MLFRVPVEILVLLIPVLLFALVFHEYSHAWVANKLGDPTARYSGRLTLNPLAHLDPFGSLMILFVGFGWAKPVPVDSRYLSNPRLDMMKIAFAGPAANLLLAFIGGTILRTGFMGGSITMMLYLFTQINIMLAVFNMIPIPPLDGSQIFSGIMMRRNPELVHKLQMYGPQILLGLIMVGYFTKISPLWIIMSPFVNFFLFLFAGL
ncbi:MAG: site-2 protease family protein [Candidatus Marinimicrobia bacterium]|jgi:Zn-dependent protease|nr:site-2 protease family protein [Candidatus Neomarinimicrobiota bacterium]MDP7217551.1 site-2 protease family protein [Candidatus Neomarinimicrobiota bacterium]MDP7437789.1 site-2 protease family protein [Candidatus Neomarinimicrobiota bacterium]|tara:strand:- start:3058 stop:3675 length:618 start_codon:yes stop_codon:yes gene_type:complete